MLLIKHAIYTYNPTDGVRVSDGGLGGECPPWYSHWVVIGAHLVTLSISIISNTGKKQLYMTMEISLFEVVHP